MSQGDRGTLSVTRSESHGVAVLPEPRHTSVLNTFSYAGPFLCTLPVASVSLTLLVFVQSHRDRSDAPYSSRKAYAPPRRSHLVSGTSVQRQLICLSYLSNTKTLTLASPLPYGVFGRQREKPQIFTCPCYSRVVPTVKNTGKVPVKVSFTGKSDFQTMNW